MPTVTASQATQTIKEEIKFRNGKVVESLPQQVRRIVDRDGQQPLYIFNVGHHVWRDRYAGNKAYVINACEPGKRYSAPTLVPFIPTYHVATDMNKMEIRLEDCEAVANDILGVGPFKSKDNDLTQYGVFLAAGPEPTEEELQAAEKAYEASDMELIHQGDVLTNEGPNGIKSITAEMRDACRRRHVVREWAKAQAAGQQCPGCGEMVAGNIRKHPLCGWRFDLGCFEGEQKQQSAPAAPSASPVAAAPINRPVPAPTPGQPIRRS